MPTTSPASGDPSRGHRPGAQRLAAAARRVARAIGLVPREEVDALRADLVALREQLTTPIAVSAGTRSLLTELAVAEPGDAGEALRLRLEHGLLHAEATAAEVAQRFQQELGDLRSTVRLTQALVERSAAPTSPEGGSADAGSPAIATPPPSARYEHPVPSFDLLYRSFEDKHRGSVEVIEQRLGDDYLEMLVGLPTPELPIVDLGCGRGELISLLAAKGVQCVGVDVNVSQLTGSHEVTLVEDDLFRWLDRQGDGTARAIVALHVVEHLPLDLQVRLVFEGRRVLAPGGLLVLETPNALSLSTAASSFWADPTHQRPVHPAFLEFLAQEAGFGHTQLLPLHDTATRFNGGDVVPDLVEELTTLLLGARDVALLARR